MADEKKNAPVQGLRKLGGWFGNLNPEGLKAVDEFSEHLKAPRWQGQFGASMEVEGLGKMPYIPHPTMFQPDPLVVGGKDQAIQGLRMLNLNPIVKQNVSQITHGPTRGTMEQMIDSQLMPGDFENTNLLGQYDRSNKQIAISPRLRRPGTQLPVLGHELAHAAGWFENGAEDAEDKLSGREGSHGTYEDKLRRLGRLK